MHPAQPRKTIRELIAELAELEDQVRRTPTVVPPDASGTSSLNPDLLELARRERQVIAQLRRHRARL